MLSSQEIFNRVVLAMVAQGSPSRGDHGFCSYRGTGGAKCAVGCLIADEHYTKHLEGNGAGTEAVIHAVELSLRQHLTNGDIDMLQQLQAAHDTRLEGRLWMDTFLKHAARIAFATKLTMPEVPV